MYVNDEICIQQKAIKKEIEGQIKEIPKKKKEKEKEKMQYIK